MSEYSTVDFFEMDGGWGGEKLAKTDYPYLVEYDSNVIIAKARTQVKQRIKETIGNKYAALNVKDATPSQVEQYERVYVTNFVKKYYETLAKLEAEQKKFTGTLVMEKVTHKGTIHTYDITLGEYGYTKRHKLRIVCDGNEITQIEEVD